MSSKRPWFPLYCPDYLGDTQHLSVEQHGAYLLLLMAMWNSQDGRLPNNERLLARITKVSGKRWTRSFAPTILPMLIVTDAWVSQKRLQKELEKCLLLSATKARAAHTKHAKAAKKSRFSVSTVARDESAKPLKNKKATSAYAHNTSHLTPHTSHPLPDTNSLPNGSEYGGKPPPTPHEHKPITPSQADGPKGHSGVTRLSRHKQKTKGEA